jgi:hypothetical protein
MQYVTADYEVVETENGFDLNTNPYVANIDLSPKQRETRFSAAYRATLGERTNAAFGFVYRINPNHINDLGNESILMMKIKHTVGL